ncbi:MAG: bifunctional RNase H/acid phosphatase [Pelotomaculum sp. PtaU1.Bin065]|nr:MAG: bifunctional RNase H/acid phosphatase [Pelotomaculum sp. PtaU1.Bin065]
MRQLYRPGEVVEIRILDVPRIGTVAGYFDDWDALEREVKKHDGKANVYISLNPVKPALLSRAVNRLVERPKNTTSDKDIEHRRWFLIDIDPQRPTGIMATDEEKKFTQDKAREVYAYLKGLGWPEPVINDSGNGIHLLYNIDLPNNDESRDLISNCLKALSFIFDNKAVSIDTSVFNAARIFRLVGTTCCKGDNTPERPHRRSINIKMPEQIGTVTKEQLQALAKILPKPQTSPNNRTYGEEFNLEQWIHNHGLPVAFSGTWQGGYKWVLNPCPWDSSHTNRSAYIIQFASGAIAAGCHHNSCQGKGWHDLRDIFEPGWRDKQRNKEQKQAQTLKTVPTDHAKKPQIDIAKLLTKPDRESKVEIPMVIPKMNESNQAEWPELEEIKSELLPVEKLPPEIIPEPFRDWLTDISYRMQCPLDFVATAAVLVTGAVIGASCGIRPKKRDDWLIIPNLWGGIVARPSMLKTPSLAEVMKPLIRLEIEAKEEYDQEMSFYNAEIEAFKATKEALRGEMVAAAKGKPKNGIPAPRMDDVKARAFKSLKTLIEVNKGETFIAVSHRCIIKVLIAAVLDMRDKYFWKFYLDNASYSTVEYDDNKGFILTCLNEACHIGKKVYEEF